MKITIHTTPETEHLVPRDEVDKWVKDNVPAGTHFTIGCEPDQRTYIMPGEWKLILR